MGWLSGKKDNSFDPPSSFDRQSFHIFRESISHKEIHRINACLEDEIFHSKEPMMRHPAYQKDVHQYCTDTNGQSFVCNSLIDPQLYPETSSLGRAIFSMFCTEEMADLISIIDKAWSHTVHQIIVFFKTPGTSPHIDGWGMDTSPPGGAMTAWIPLEPITILNGPIGVYPWPRGKFLHPRELGMELTPGKDDRYENEEYHKALTSYIRGQRIDCVVPQLDPGDFIIFSALTPHVSIPAMGDRTRRALQIIIRPFGTRWGGRLPNRLSGKYKNREPFDAMVLNERWNARTIPQCTGSD